MSSQNRNSVEVWKNKVTCLTYMHLDVRFKPASWTIKKNSIYWCLVKSGRFSVLQRSGCSQAQANTKRVFWKDVQKSLINPRQKTISGSEGIFGKWKMRLFFTVSKELYELFHLFLSALAWALCDGLAQVSCLFGRLTETVSLCLSVQCPHSKNLLGSLQSGVYSWSNH